jgi:hypothetical protein
MLCWHEKRYPKDAEFSNSKTLLMKYFFRSQVMAHFPSKLVFSATSQIANFARGAALTVTML